MPVDVILSKQSRFRRHASGPTIQRHIAQEGLALGTRLSLILKKGL